MTDSILSRAPVPRDARVAYGVDPLQFGELRLPAGPGPHPVGIIIHGGYWRNHVDLTYTCHMSAALTALGLATWNIEYRRVGDRGGGWPGTFADVAAAANALRDLAAPHRLDLSRVVAVGHSAGGHLALWLAARPRVPSSSPIFDEHPLPLRGVVSLAGVVDLRRASELHLSRDAAHELLGGPPDHYPERYAAASPIELVPLGLPQVLLHGTGDQSVPFELSQRYISAAAAAGDPAMLVTLPGADHFALVDPTLAEWPRVADTILGIVRCPR